MQINIVYFISIISFCIIVSNQSIIFAIQPGGAVVNSDKLKIEKFVLGLEYPTGLAFLNSNDFLVLEKNNGTVQRVINGTILQEPVLDVNVNGEVERGMLGIAVSKNNSANSNKTFVFLYYTEAKDQDGGEPIGNRLYRYEFVNDKLINPKLLLDLPYKPGPSHNGGVIAIGQDGNVYVAVGNLFSGVFNNGSQESTLDQNIKGGDAPDGRGGILRISQEGKPVNDEEILGAGSPLKFYFAYGIRNSFGIAFDPISGNLWDTENGGMYDEINLVQSGFNSGWNKIIGKSSVHNNFSESELVDFNGKGKYSDPEFSLISDRDFRSAPTAIVFFNSNKFGEEFKNDMFVGDIRGNIYHFDLNDDRTELSLSGSLADKIADNSSEVQRLRFANMTDVITDLDVGPDGYMYTTLYDKKGAVFRIIPKNP